MSQELKVVYKDSDKSIIGFLGADLDAEEHEAISAEGVKVSSEILFLRECFLNEISHSLKS